jgi:hypothetical protein
MCLGRGEERECGAAVASILNMSSVTSSRNVFLAPVTSLREGLSFCYLGKTL